MIKKTVLSTLSLALTFLLSAVAEKQKNVLFIGFDDLRPLLGCYGDPIAKTPNLDRFAKRSLLFRNAHVQQAVCAASRASYLTGCRPETTGVDYPYSQYFVKEFLPEHPTLMKRFMDEGWYVRAFGKLHHSYSEHFSGPSEMFWGNQYIAPENKNRPKKENEPFEHPDVKDEDYADGKIARKTIEVIREHVKKGSAQPFFLATGFYKPHLPWSCPKKYHDLYKTEDMPLPEVKGIPENGFPHTLAHYALSKYAGEKDTDTHQVSDERARQLIHSYYACVSYADAQFGKVIDTLDELGVFNNTIIIVWSDHGWHLGDQGMWGKSANYYLDTHVQLMLAAPGMKTAGQQSKALVEYVDMYPTITELASINTPDYLEGTSLVPLLKNPNRPWKRAVFAQFPRWHKTIDNVEGFAIQNNRYRYIEWRERKKGGPIGKIKARELYDHTQKPLESINLADDPHYAHAMENLSQQLSEGWKAALPKGIENKSDNPPAPPFVKWSRSDE